MDLSESDVIPSELLGWALEDRRAGRGRVLMEGCLRTGDGRDDRVCDGRRLEQLS